MNREHQLTASKRAQPQLRICRDQAKSRRGSTLLVVMALMGMLALLGLMFFSFASQEQENAKNYLEAARLVHDPDLGPEVYFRWALRQVIVGPRDSEKQSALYPGHLSLLPNAYGSDAHPHTGVGIELENDGTTSHDLLGAGLTAYSPQAFIDSNKDGVIDPAVDQILDIDQDGLQDYIELNRSVAANVQNPNGGLPVTGIPQRAFEHRSSTFPQPDVDYTYPDINNAYLAHIGKIWVNEDPDGDGTPDYDFNGTAAPPYRYEISVIKPSFFRPELLMRLETAAAGSSYDEDANGDGIWDPLLEDANGNGVYDVSDFNRNGTQDPVARFDPTWYWQTWSRSLTLRPHPLHFYIPPQPPRIPGLPTPPPAPPPSELRFLRDWDATDATIISGLPGGSQGFPFAGPREVNAPHNTVALREGVWRGWLQAPDASLGVSQYEFDADADNDGIREAILLDLDFPVQERPSDGALYIPMFAITIYDADGLINLNTSGNLAGDTSPPTVGPGTVFGNGLGASITQPSELSVSKSFHGLTPYEINPGWALDAYPIDPPGNPTPPAHQTVDVAANTDYAEYFGRSPIGNSDIVNRWELANMEMWWMNKGRIDFGGALPDIHAGRMGEANRVWQVLQSAGGGPSAGGTAIINLNQYTPGGPQSINLFPFPGYFDRDDNRNSNYGGSGNDSTGRTLAFGCPLSVSGRGSIISGTNPRILNMVSPASTPMAWLRYTNFDVAGTPELAGLTVGGASFVSGMRRGRLFVGPGADGVYDILSNVNSDDDLVDDMTEMVVDPRHAPQPADEYFTEADASGLHLSKTDIDAVGVHSRVTEVMPGNINPNDTSVAGNERRRRFTTTSWDRKQFSLPRLSALGADGKPGIAGFDDNRNQYVDDPAETGWPGSDDDRAWEFNVDLDGDGRAEFPPQFTGVAAFNGHDKGKLSQVPQDPFRAELRRILSVEHGNRNELKLQFRLGINGVLDVQRSGQTGGHSITSPLEYRPLTPHITAASLPPGGLLPIAPGDFLPQLTTTQPANQEFWARYDRQRMARDIYVLLYTLCAGPNTEDLNGNGVEDGGEIWTGPPDTSGMPTPNPWNTTTIPGATLYEPEQLKEMAQFAVNLVDELDQDDVITIFEYDTDLSDGWDLDDQAFTDEPFESDREVVAGVETQSLTISETLWVRQQEMANDNTYTPFDESSAPAGTSGMGAPSYHFVQIELRNIGMKSEQLAHSSLTTTAATGVWRLRWVNDASINNVDDISTDNNITMPANGIVFQRPEMIGAGNLFSIATSNYTAPGSSDLFIDFDPGTADHELIAPRFGTNTTSCTNSPTSLTPNTDLDLVHTTTPGYTGRYALVNGVLGDFLSADYEPTIGNPILVLERRADPNTPQLPVTQNPWVVVDWTRLTRRDFVDPSVGSGGSPTQADTTNRLTALTSRERSQPLNGLAENNYSGGPDPNRLNSIKGTVIGVVEGRNVTGPSTYNLLQPHFNRDYASVLELFLLPVRGPKELTRSVQGGDQPPSSQYSGNVPFTAMAKFLLPSHPSGNGQLHNHWHRLLSLVEVPTKMHHQLGDEFATTRVPGKINLNTLRHPQVLLALLDSPLIHSDFNTANGTISTIDSGVDLWGDFLLSRDGEHPEYAGLPPTQRPGLTLPGLAAANPFRDLGHTDNIAAGVNPVEDTVLRSHPTGATGTNGGLFDINTTGNGNAVLRRQMLTKVLNNTTTRSNVFYVFVHVQFHEAYQDSTTGAVRIGGQIDLNGDKRRDDGHRGFFIVDRSAAEEAYDPKTGQFEWEPLVKQWLTIH